MPKACLFQRVAKLLPKTLVFICISSCSSGQDADAFRQPVKFDALRPIAAEMFAQDKEVQKQILFMPFLVAQERLGTFRLNAHSTITLLGAGERVFTQEDHYALATDLQANYQGMMQTPHTKMEALSLPEYYFSRVNDGQMHRLLKREVASEQLSDVIFSSRTSVLELFLKGLSFAEKEIGEVAGREALKFRVMWKSDQPGLGEMPEGPTKTSLARTIEGKWREKATREELQGFIWLDRASGVWSRAELSAKLFLKDEGAEPIMMTLTYDFSIEDIAERITFEAPKKWRDKKHLSKQLDPLAFFRKHMPKEETVLEEQKAK